MTHEQRLTPATLEAIRERADRATEGNWRHTLLSHEHRTFTVGAFNGDVTVVGDINNESDADFIANAREDIPALLAEVERLKAENKRLRSGIDSVMYDLYNEDCSDEFVVSQIVAELMQTLGGDA